MLSEIFIDVLIASFYLTVRPAQVSHAVVRRGGYVPHEKVQRLVLLPEPLSPEAGTLTRTLKVRRDAVMAKYKGEIERMFRA